MNNWEPIEYHLSNNTTVISDGIEYKHLLNRHFNTQID